MYNLADLQTIFKPTLSRVDGVDKLFDLTAYYPEQIDFTTNGYWMIKSDDQPNMVVKAKRREISNENRQNAERVAERFMSNPPSTELYLGKWFDISQYEYHPLLRVKSADKTIKVALNAYYLAMIGSIYHSPIIKGNDPLKPVYFYRNISDLYPFALCMPVRYRF